MIKRFSHRALLAGIVLACLAPASFAVKPNKDKERCDDRDRREHRCGQVPEGGSAAIYLLGAGVTCLGAMFVRARSAQVARS
jgi:hypothetical protein